MVYLLGYFSCLACCEGAKRPLIVLRVVSDRLDCEAAICFELSVVSNFIPSVDRVVPRLGNRTGFFKESLYLEAALPAGFGVDDAVSAGPDAFPGVLSLPSFPEVFVGWGFEKFASVGS